MSSQPGDMASLDAPLESLSMSPSSRLTAHGRLRRGRKGKRVHGCVFCRKIYTRREHLRRHQSKHETGTFPCSAPRCGCTFSDADLRRQHEQHEWPFRFAPEPNDMFSCPCLPPTLTQDIPRTPRSNQLHRSTPSDNGITTDSEEDASYSPTPSYEGSQPDSIGPREELSLAPRPPNPRYLSVPSRGPNAVGLRHERHHSTSFSATSSANFQDVHYASPLDHMSGGPPLSYHQTMQRHASDGNMMQLRRHMQAERPAMLVADQLDQALTMPPPWPEPEPGYQADANLFASTHLFPQLSAWHAADPRSTSLVGLEPNPLGGYQFEENNSIDDYQLSSRIAMDPVPPQMLQFGHSPSEASTTYTNTLPQNNTRYRTLRPATNNQSRHDQGRQD